jgi:ABC-2 type transport system permease protein
MILRAIAAIIVRELRRTLRQRGRLLSSLVRPLLWLVVIGGGVETMVARDGSYRDFLVPGLVAMALLFGGMLAALSLVHDKESGVLRMLLAAPLHHGWIVVARTLSAAAAGLLQALLLLAVLAACGWLGAGTDWPLLAAGLALTALAAATLGMLVAVWARSLENFAVMMNLVIFPLFFLSGALYPVQRLPFWLKAAAVANPFSYGVDLLKHACAPAPGASGATLAPDFTPGVDALVLAVFIVVGTALAALRFSSPSTIAALGHLLGKGKAA